MNFKITFVTYFVLLCVAGNTQEVSLNLPVMIGNGDTAPQVEKYNDDFILLTSSFCHEGSYDYCVGLMRVDRNGNVIWNKIHNSSPYSYLHCNGKTMSIFNDSIYLAGMLWKDSLWEVRLIRYDTDGELVLQTDYSFSYSNRFYLRGGGIYDNEYILFGELQTADGRFAFVWRFDLNFKIIEKHLYGIHLGVKNVVNFRESKNGGYLLIYEEDLPIGGNQVVISRLDSNFEVINSFMSFPVFHQFVPGLNVYETEDSGYIISWQADLFDVLDTFPYPTSIIKLDYNFNYVWETIFASREEKGAIATRELSDGGLIGIGATSYWYHYDIIPESSFDGWCFRMDKSGDVLWERGIKDVSNAFGGRLWDGLIDDQGFVFVGDLDTKNPSGVPFLNDPDVWFLTLNKDGCWNDDCGDFIVINSDSTSSIEDQLCQPDQQLSIYPNPTNEKIILEWPADDTDPKRSVQLVNALGEIVLDQKLLAPRSIVYIQGYTPGVYYLRHFVDGLASEVRQIIIQN